MLHPEDATSWVLPLPQSALLSVSWMRFLSSSFF